MSEIRLALFLSFVSGCSMTGAGVCAVSLFLVESPHDATIIWVVAALCLGASFLCIKVAIECLNTFFLGGK